MSKVKYRVREYTPKTQNQGTHSWFAEVVVNNDIENAELAQKIAARTGFKAYECQAIVAAIADIVAEEVKESNRISLANEQGTKMLSIYPKVSGGISDAQVQADPEKYDGATVATEDMLTPDMLTWTLGATVGIKFSKEFALHKQAMKVKFVGTDVTIPNDDNPGDDDSQGGGTTPVTPDPGTGGGGSGDNGGDDGGGGDGPIGDAE
ncbi:MAG: hypothetical protein IK144_08905 [Bacteroidaceae bacterium]|nr:hypothetical protein [Bacteroidaceae bacterium]